MFRSRHTTAADLQVLLVGALRIADAAIVVLSALLAFWLRHDSLALPDLYIVAIIVAVVLTANYMHVAGLYVFGGLTRLAVQIGRLTMSWLAVILTLIAFAYFTKYSEQFSRAFVIAWFAISVGGFVLARIAMVYQIDRWRRSGKLSLNVAVVGGGEIGQQLIRQLDAQDPGEWRVIGVFDDRHTRVPEDIDGHKIQGTVDDLIRRTREMPVDEIVVALPWRAAARLQQIVKKLKTVPINVKICPESFAWDLPIRGFRSVAGLPMLAVLERPLSGWSIVAKTLEDQIIAAVLFVLFLPLFALIALAIRLDSRGPVLFKQTRYGFNNDDITVFKFRTMAHQPEEEKDVPQARRNDPRVTRVGRFLRRTSLDELPQLLNVLRGEMSLVGPRPHAVAHNEHYAKIIDEYLGRHRVKPGITGWAQVNGLRGETDTAEKMRMRVQYDLYYIDNWSLLFDLKILALTPFVGFVHRNAY
jgi:putative colanic acid biosynthesis UDP-glucose lipid carrier transferase